MDACVIICTYNRAALLRGALTSLVELQTGGEFDYEIIVVDDGSTDDTPDVVSDCRKQSSVPVRYIQTGGVGVGPAMNIAIQASSADWIAWFDDDQIADPRWLWELIRAARKTGAGCLGSRRVLRFQFDEIQVLSRTCREMLGEHTPYPASQPYRGKLFPQGGTAMFARRTFTTVGPLRPPGNLGSGDTGFFRAARECGIENWYVPEAVVFHLVPRYRVNPDYFRWYSIRLGCKLASMDYDDLGRTRTLLTATARLSQALLLNAPKLAIAIITMRAAEVLKRKCLLWRALGYCRQTLHLLVPRAFKQAQFFSSLEFRSERNSRMAVG